MSCSFKKSTIAAASICYVLQESVSEEYQPFNPKTETHKLRDDWLKTIVKLGFDLRQIQNLLEVIRFLSGRQSTLWPIQIHDLPEISRLSLDDQKQNDDVDNIFEGPCDEFHRGTVSVQQRMM